MLAFGIAAYLNFQAERYKPHIVPAEEVREVWRAIGYYSTQFPQV